MSKIVFLKSHVHSYTTKEGVFVGEHDNKVIKHDKPKKKKPEAYHPSGNDKGMRVPIYKLSEPTGAGTWRDKLAVATITPHNSESMPDELFGVKFEAWTDAPDNLQDWADVDGQTEIDEPDYIPIKGLAYASGVIVQEQDGRVWIVHPTNKFGGYSATFPKGTLEKGLELQASAIKEAYEESGLKVEITGFLGDIERTTSKARYYTAKRIGGSPTAMGWESQAVSLVPVDKLSGVANSQSDVELINLIKKNK